MALLPCHAEAADVEACYAEAVKKCDRVEAQHAEAVES